MKRLQLNQALWVFAFVLAIISVQPAYLTGAELARDTWEFSIDNNSAATYTIPIKILSIIKTTGRETVLEHIYLGMNDYYQISKIVKNLPVLPHGVSRVDLL